MYFSLLKSKTNKTDVYIYVCVYTVRMHVLYVNYFIFLSFVFFSKCKWLNKAMKSQIPSVCTHTLNSWLWFRFFSPYNRAALAYTRTSGILRKFTACVRLHLWFSLCTCVFVSRYLGSGSNGRSGCYFGSSRGEASRFGSGARRGLGGLEPWGGGLSFPCDDRTQTRG